MIRTSCLGCPYLQRSTRPERVGEPDCLFTGFARSMEWSDVTDREAPCPHGVSIRVMRPWTTAEIAELRREKARGEHGWAVRFAAKHLRSVHAVRLAADYHARTSQPRPRTMWRREEIAEMIEVVQSARRCRERQRRLCERLGIDTKHLQSLANHHLAAKARGGRNRSVRERQERSLARTLERGEVR